MDISVLINKHKNKILNIGIILLILLFANILYKQQDKKVRLLQEKRDLAAKKGEVLKGISQLEEKIKAYNELLAGKEVSQSINALSGFASQTGIKINSIKPFPQKEMDYYVRIPFDLSLTAPDYHALAEFISMVESAEDVYVVKEVKTGSSKGAESLGVTLKIDKIEVLKE